MAKNYRVGATALPYLFGGTILVGSIASGFLSRDNSWMGWHFSRLGEGGTLAAYIFNAALLTSGIIMLTIAFYTKFILNRIYKKSTNRRNRANVFFALMSLIAFCLICLSFFPFDKYPIIHNIAGYSMLLLALSLAVISYILLPIFSKYYQRMVIAILGLTIIMYSLYFITGGISLLVIEFISFLMIFMWFKIFIDTIYNYEQK